MEIVQHAVESWRAFAHSIDDYRAAWITAQGEACRRSRVRGEDPVEISK
jgi:hypothetical protein